MKNRFRIAFFLMSGALAPGQSPVFAIQEPTRDEDRYAACMDMADRVPDKGINLALEWMAAGGGVPARHCEAYGLARMGEHAEAAARFMKIAEDMRIGRDMPVRMGRRVVATEPMLADMYGQAANAWLLAGEIIRSEDAIDLAITLSAKGTSQEYELTLDRARIAAADEDFGLALKDLDYVLAKDPGRKDILVLIASAARGVGDLQRAEQALVDFQQAYPDDASGYLELGNLRHTQGRQEDARQAWIKVLLIEEAGENATAARANLEKLDVKNP